MCLAKAYLGSNGKRELLMQEVASLEVRGSKLRLTTLFGEQREIDARIKEIDFMSSSIVLAGLKAGKG
jgi:predicted RNA-binding protein